MSAPAGTITKQSRSARALLRQTRMHRPPIAANITNAALAHAHLIHGYAKFPRDLGPQARAKMLQDVGVRGKCLIEVITIDG